MRGDDRQQLGVFSYVSLEQRVPSEHPLRVIRALADEALSSLSWHVDTLYAKTGRPSIAPEKLVRALLLEVLFSIRSERQLMEQLNYNLLFRWFVGLEVDDPVWDVTVFTKNRERLVAGEVTERLLLAVVEQAHARRLLSEEHFTIDGTLIKAWANRRSFTEKKDPPVKGSGSGGKKLLRDTHESKTDPEARLYRKSKATPAIPCYQGHVLMENRNGLVLRTMATQSSAKAEREAALVLLDDLNGRPAQTTLGADTAYQEPGFLEQLRARGVAPHIPEYPAGSEPSILALNALTEEERHDPRREISQKKRKMVEKIFGWGKLDRMLHQIKLRGLGKVNWAMQLVAVAHNLRRMQTLIAYTG